MSFDAGDCPSSDSSEPGLANGQRLRVQKTAKRKIWKLVLTGGPCAGKTTGQARLSTFFEGIGWKVYRVPEAANLLLSGGVSFTELSEKQAENFQENLLKTMMQVETTYFELAANSKRDVLIICDRGCMDASAYISPEIWHRILHRNNLNEVDIRDNRYNQVVHLVSAADGAEEFYSIDNSTSRHECIEDARRLDVKAAQAWVGHPNVAAVDNSSDFDGKINSLISKVVRSMGLDVGDRLQLGARKVKFVINGPMEDGEFPVWFRDFDVCHDYLVSTDSNECQARLRKRGCCGRYTYTHTQRTFVADQLIEVKTPLSHRDYLRQLTLRDPNHFTVHKTRRCFLYGNQYFQLDIYREPAHERCKGLMLLETYTTLPSDELRARLPNFLDIGVEVTGDPAFSMFNLSLTEDWAKSRRQFCLQMKQATEELANANLSRHLSVSQDVLLDDNKENIDDGADNTTSCVAVMADQKTDRDYTTNQVRSACAAEEDDAITSSVNEATIRLEMRKSRQLSGSSYSGASE